MTIEWEIDRINEVIDIIEERCIEDLSQTKTRAKNYLIGLRHHLKNIAESEQGKVE